MIIEIPDELIKRIFNVHPEGSIKDALKVYSQASHSFDDRFIKIAIGEYVISEMMKQP